MLENTGIQVAFEEFRDTGIYERYMLNTAQFSAAKSFSEAKIMQSEVFDGQRLKSFQEFSKDVNEIVDIQQQTWLRVEYDTCRKNAIAGSRWAQMMEGAALYPYWVWRGRMDKRERPEHVEMEGKVFRKGDPAGDKCFPPADWNCRCEGEDVDDLYLEENKVQPATPDEARELLDQHVAENFRYNPAQQGPLPNEHSYFDLFDNANMGSAKLFGLDDPEKLRALRDQFAGNNLRYIMEMVSDWRRKYHVDSKHNIVFQNKATWTNVRLGDTAVHEIAKHSRLMENLPATIQHPTEIWSSWEDPGSQRVVLRNYIKMGKSCYVVQTRDGRVTNAFAIARTNVKKYRRGVIVR